MLPALIPLIPLALQLVPLLARHLGGAEAGAVAGQVTEVVRRVVGSDDPDQAAAAIEADPAMRAELTVALARIASDREMAEIAAIVEAARIAATDRADARAMARSGPLAWGAGLVTAGAFLMLLGLGMVLALVEVPPGNREVLLMLAGTVTAMAGAAAQFWVGSSAGSAGKSGLLGGPGGGRL